MKKSNMFCLAVLLLLSTGFLVAQTTFQMPKWPLNGKEVNFIDGTVDNTGVSLTTPEFVSNGYYDRDNNPLFYVIDNNLWWGNGTYAGQLFTDVDPVEWPDDMFPEVIIVPKDTLYCDDGEFYIFYALKQYVEDTSDSRGDNPVINYSLACNEVFPGRGQYEPSEPFYTADSSVDHRASMGIAITDFIPGTNHRRLYLVYYSWTHQESFVKFFDVGPDGITGPYNVVTYTNNYKLFEPCEVEISRDRSKLAFTRPKYFANVLLDNSNDITIVNLNPSTGYLGTGGVTYKDLGPTNVLTDHYIGLEFSSNSQDIFVTKHQEGLIQYNLPTNQVTTYSNTSDISNSLLETSRDGFIYGIAPTGQLYKFDPANPSLLISPYNVGTSAVIDNDIFSTAWYPVYVLPEQIDGYNYDGLWGNPEICCYPWLENDSVRHYNGVQYEGDDIRITSGTSVVWSTTNNPWTPQGVAITDVYLKGNIIIEKNALMQVSGLTMHFKEDKGIQMTYATSTLEKGSRLFVLSNAKLTAFDECDEDALWDGINCFGNASQPQYPYSNSRQPYVYIAAATIEFAEIAVEAPNGGIVRTSTANFKDNVIDVSFSGNNNYDQTVLSGSNFYTTADLYNKGYTPGAHAHLWNGSGVIFKGCDFYNDYAYQNSISKDYWGVGILATYSDIIVEENGTTRGTFAHLNYGMKIDLGTSFTMEKQDFTDCYRSAWIIGNDGVSVTECNFDVSAYTASSSYFNYIFGLYLESCSGFYISENIFRDGRVGLIVYNSSAANQQVDNEIYKNTFQNLTGTYSSSFIGIGDNSGWPTQKVNGLQLKCNTFGYFGLS